MGLLPEQLLISAEKMAVAWHNIDQLWPPL